jgi:hypothetical protein
VPRRPLTGSRKDDVPWDQLQGVRQSLYKSGEAQDHVGRAFLPGFIADACRERHVVGIIELPLAGRLHVNASNEAACL